MNANWMNLTGNNKGWTALDCGDGASLCAASVRTAVAPGERPKVLACREIHHVATVAEAESLRTVLAPMDRSLPVLMTLGRSQYRLQVMAEPPVSLREMEASLRWQLSTTSEEPMDEMNLAWMRIPTEELLPVHHRQVYAVMANRAVLDARIAVLRQAGARAKVVDIRETALRNICGALERPGEGLALVSAEGAGVGMVFTYQGSLYLDRFIEQPVAELHAVDPAARQKLHERIALQLLRSIDFIARNYPFMPIARVVVAPLPDAPGLEEFLASQLPLSVEVLDLSQVFDLSGVPELRQSQALQARSLVALGAALRSAGGAGSKVAA
jgi:MSHA biogenesis protein MshI